MDKSKTLLLLQTDADNDPIFNKWIKNGYNADLIFKDVPRIMRLFRRIFLKNKKNNLKFLYRNWINELEQYSTVIIHSSELTYNIAHYIKVNYPKIRIIIWYWNKVTEKNNPLKYDKDIELWSFDKLDCEMYNMNYNIQYYEPSYDISNNIKIDKDIFFIGHDEGRRKSILDFQNIAVKMGLNCDIRISDTYGGWFIPYTEVEKCVMSTKAILELNRTGQSGVTLRTMESLFYNKKLITNNKDIINEPYYSSRNVFIIGLDKYDNLIEFVNSEYDHSVDKFREHYNLKAWFQNFDI